MVIWCPLLALRKKGAVQPIVILTCDCPDTEYLLNGFSIPITEKVVLDSFEPETSKPQSATMLAFEKLLRGFNPSFLLIHGESSNTFQAGLCAFYRNIPIGYIRTQSNLKPTLGSNQENINQKLINALAEVQFMPKREGRNPNNSKESASGAIFEIGNPALICMKMASELDFSTPYDPLLDKNGHSIFVSLESRHSMGPQMLQVFMALRELALTHQNLNIFYPVAKNPNIQTPAKDLLSDLSNIHLLEPLDYFTQAKMIKNCSLIITDSQSLLEETGAFGIPRLGIIQKQPKGTIVREIEKVLQNWEGWIPVCEASAQDINSAKYIADRICNYLYFRQSVTMREENLISNAA